MKTRQKTLLLRTVVFLVGVSTTSRGRVADQTVRLSLTLRNPNKKAVLALILCRGSESPHVRVNLTRQFFATLIKLHVKRRYCYFYCDVLSRHRGAILAVCRTSASPQCGVGARFAALSALQSGYAHEDAPAAVEASDDGSPRYEFRLPRPCKKDASRWEMACRRRHVEHK